MNVRLKPSTESSAEPPRLTPSGNAEMDRFTDLTKKLVQVPKAAIDPRQKPDS